MLSPTLPVPASSEGSSAPEQSTRRRGLSYLRSLSSHSSAANSDQPRVSPRHFFQRSTSYNENSKNKPNSGRRRSTSKPDEPTNLPIERQSLPITRVLSADNPSIAVVENRAPIQETGEASTREAEQLSTDPGDMARTVSSGTRRATEGAATAIRPAMGARGAASHNDVSATNNVSSANGTDGANSADEPKPRAPTIRLFPHHELRNGRQSLNFAPVSRTLPNEGSIIRVGRYSEREGLPIAMPSTPSEAPVGFKSKVVSRKHCEFSFVDGQWHIRDVASSSGTFLNHIRLSQPNQESRLFPIKDGDIVQLGIDFRGGEEMIFRCVKIRIECHRSWQKKPNTFNKTRRAQILGLTKDQPAAGQNSGECAICLGSVLPCQSLFVAPCAHVWHYKCIRPMLEGKQSHYPQFQCPNCRAWADLEADVDVAEEDMEEWMENEENTDEHVETDQTDRPDTAEPASGADNSDMDIDTSAHPSTQPSAAPPTVNGLLARRAANQGHASSTPAVNGIDMPARPSQDEMEQHLAQQQTRTESPSSDQITAGEGPLTPRNNAGPFVFDGSGESGASRRLTVPTLPEITEGRQL